jgi:hypothetical protein
MDRSLDVPGTVQVEFAKGGAVLLPCIMQLQSAWLLVTQICASSLQVHILLHTTCDLTTDLFNPFWIPDWASQYHQKDMWKHKNGHSHSPESLDGRKLTAGFRTAYGIQFLGICY